LTDHAAIITAIIGIAVPLLTLIGAGVRWLWNKVEARFTSIEAQLEECRKREAESRERRAAQLTVIELLWLKVRELDPGAEVLKRAEALLDKLKASAGSDGH
jgi:hypothetical protein